MKSAKSIYIYYLLLFVALVFVFNRNAPISNVIRIIYLLLLLGPVVYYKRFECVPPIIICFYTASTYSFGYTLMPSDPRIYLLIPAVLTFVFLLGKFDIKYSLIRLLLIAMYIFFINFINGDRDIGIIFNIFIIFFLSLLSNNCKKEDLIYFKLAIIGISVALAVWFVFFPENHTKVYNTVGGLEQTGWRDPNYYCGTMCMGLIVCFIELFNQKLTKIQYVLLFFVIILVMVATLMNASRGVILAIILSVVFLFVNLKIKTTWKILFVLLSAVFLYYVYTSSTFELLFARFAEEDSTASGRTSIWGTKLSWFLEGSITDVLFGKGHDTAVKYGGMGFHNDFIAALVEYGIVGLLILLSAFLYPLRLSSKQNRIPVCALILYLAIVSCSIEPITTGSFAPLAYLFFITQYSCLSKTN